MMRLHRYSALGNDYLVLDLAAAPAPGPAAIRAICDRHFGVGSDGLLLHCGAEGDGHRLRIFNPDGSEAEKSGNGLRIFARYLFDRGLVAHGRTRIALPRGEVWAQVLADGQVTVDMGQAVLDAHGLPDGSGLAAIAPRELEVGGRSYAIHALSLGNPHCVLFAPRWTREEVLAVGPVLERHPLFPNRSNVQFATVQDRGSLSLQIWERGAGYTHASGSSACAAACMANALGLCGAEVTVSMPGGQLLVRVDDGRHVRMTGPALPIAEIALHPEFERRLPPG